MSHTFSEMFVCSECVVAFSFFVICRDGHNGEVMLGKQAGLLHNKRKST